MMTKIKYFYNLSNYIPPSTQPVVGAGMDKIYKSYKWRRYSNVCFLSLFNVKYWSSGVLHTNPSDSTTFWSRWKYSAISVAA